MPSPFPSTHWSIVLHARDRASPQADEALATLCQLYWYPLYAFIRREVGSVERAEDLTQEFFARLLTKDFLGSVDRDRGTFRSFLLACCRHFLANQRDAERAEKRGGGRVPLSLDFPAAADRYTQEPADTQTAERLFERRWALTLLDQALEQLREEHQRDCKGPLYDRLKGALVGEAEGGSYGEIGAAFGMTEGAVKKAAQRLRQRYRAILRERIAATVETPEQVEDEVRSLFAVLGP